MSKIKALLVISLGLQLGVDRDQGQTQWVVGDNKGKKRVCGEGQVNSFTRVTW